MLNDNNFLALRPEWVLRNDENKVILYLISSYNLEYVILDPITAIVVPLLNGQHKVKDLVEIINYLINPTSPEKARSLLEHIVGTLNINTEKVAILEGQATWTIDYDPLDFIISPDDFVSERRLTKPISLMIYFSGWCQTNCIYCYADLMNMRRCKHLSLKQWIPILRDAKELDIRKIQLTGGDPLGRPDSVDFLTHLIEQDFLFMVSTKCYVSLSDAQRIVDAGFNKAVNGVNRDFQVSIDSPDPVVADYITGSKGYLERATETLCNLNKVGISTQVKAVLTPLNYHQVNNLIETFADIGVKVFRFSSYGRSYYRHDESLFLSDEMKTKAANLLNVAIREWPDITIEGDATKFVPSIQNNQHQRKERWAARAGCSAGRTNLGIAPDGQAVLCEQMPLVTPYFVGDLTQQSILEIWNSPKLLDFIFPPRELFSGTPCYNCADFTYCIHNHGHCFRESFFAYGRLHHPPPNCPKTPDGAYRSF